MSFECREGFGEGCLRLFIAAVLTQYGSIVTEKIKNAAGKLKECDDAIAKNIDNLEDGTAESQSQSFKAIKRNIHLLSKDLIDMNHKGR